ncbi:MAG: GNAT family N-acetyltransferase [Myxococcota bacterium]|nr:GNAT family N-acetyltransferase [Deltaproteobacteria bacterium]MDQ3338011.1 GNAT family N-acetyltransferase [Myxococcota bacterium]
MKVQRRPAFAHDLSFLEDVHIRALGPVALVGYGWPAFRLRDQFHKEIHVMNCHVIIVDGVDAGYLSIEDKREFWYIDAIAIAPKYQRKGVGTATIKDVLADAGTLPVRLNVLHINRAKSLYERLGFRTIMQDARRQIMEWRGS